MQCVITADNLEALCVVINPCHRLKAQFFVIFRRHSVEISGNKMLIQEK